MGKQRRQRKKFHASPNAPPPTPSTPTTESMDYQPIPVDNVFSGVNINVNSLKTTLNDDTRSIKSFKSLKSEGGEQLKKKDKLRLKRDILLRKIDTVTQMKKENKKRSKRKQLSVIGDVNPLHDALPSLESLLKPKSNANSANKLKDTIIKQKAIEKASKRQKQMVEGVKVLKTIMSNKLFQNNPLDFVAAKVKAGLELEKYT